MELGRRKIILTGSVHKTELGGGFFEERSDVIGFLGDKTVEGKGKVGSWESGGCNGLSSELLVEVVKLTNFFKGSLNLSAHFFKLLFGEGSFKIFILFHENLWKYLIHVDTRDFVKLSLVDHENEVVHFFRVAKVSGPDLELDMLLLDLFDEIGKEQLHFVLHGGELRNFGVGIFVENVFNLTPFHFFTGFVE